MSFSPERTRADDVEQVFVSLVPDIERAARVAARRALLDPAESDDVASEVKLRLIENDYAALRRFDGRSSLRTYVVTIVQRILIDRRRRSWGRFRPSAEAVARGAVAERLERLLYGDRLTLDEAIESIRASDASQDRESLLRIAYALPVRPDRRVDGDRSLESLPDRRTSDPEREMSGRAAAERLQEVVDEAVQGLSPTERIVMRLRFEDGVSVADIARTLLLDQKKLYRRIDDWIAGLRLEVERAGLAWRDLRETVERGHCSLRIRPPEPKNPPDRPSHQRARP